jgi:P-type Cu+ transporter
MLRLAASAEQASEHPIARAIVDGARKRGLALEQPTDVRVEPGAGISAVVSGKRVAVGTLDFLAFSGTVGPRPIDDQAAMSISHVAIDGAYAGAIAVSDPPAAGVREVIERLRALGIQPVMVSGDREPAARRVAQQIGITEVYANTRPAEKAAIVRRLRERTAGVAMVGDGINDAPALAAADLGIAIGSGTEIAAATADVTLIRGGITTLPVAFTLARQVLRTIRRNLAAASIYNVVCIPIASLGLLSPVFASAAMSLSSVSVLISSLALRLRRV